MGTSCVIWGGYAGGNVGDELALAVAISDASERFAGSVAVLSRVPEYTRWLFPDVTVVPYKVPRSARRADQRLRDLYRSFHGGGTTQGRLRSLKSEVRNVFSDGDEVMRWIHAVEGCDQLYLSGGGYLTDLFDLAYVAAPINVAKRAGVPVASAPLGIGPFSNRRSADAVSDLLRNEKVIVRDELSRSFCVGKGIDCRQEPDDGFRASEVVEGLTSLADVAAREPRIGICIFDQPGGEDRERSRPWWEAFLRSMRHRSADKRLEGFCFHTRPELDFRTTVGLFAASGLDPSSVSAPTLDFRAAIRSVAGYSVVVSSRFHAIVIAIVLGLPYIAVASGPYYRSKMEMVVEMDRNTGRGRLASLPDDDPEELAAWAVDASRARSASTRSGDMEDREKRSAGTRFTA